MCSPLSATSSDEFKSLLFAGLREKELALYAGPWLDPLICDHLGMGQQAYSSSYSEILFAVPNHIFLTHSGVHLQKKLVPCWFL